MKITSWNVRGLSAPDKRCLVKRSLTKLESDMILLQETKLSGEKVYDFIKYCYKWEDLFQDARGASGGLGILWNSEAFEVVPIASNEFWMACNIRCKSGGIGFPLFNIYGSIKIDEKLRVWSEIYDQLQLLEMHKVIMARDFNAILDIDDKEGGLGKSTKVMEDFREFISTCQVVDVIPKNGKFTWTNRRLNFSKIYEKLDRFFVGEWWIDGSFSIHTNIIPQVGSDHIPVTLSTNHESPKNKNYFKFQSMWWRDPKFIELLKNWWLERNTYSGSPSFRFVKRIQYIKNKMKHWNKFSFKNIFIERLKIEEGLEDINNRVMIVGMVGEDYLKEKLLKEQHVELLNREEIYWRDKSQALWIAEGDHNTKFFHAFSKVRRNKNKITSVLDNNGALRITEAKIEQVALEHLERILGSYN
ncbi:uncharacterized protein LOC131047335 [Cryptomeria japonica]|uniref:uncharacterized protein LOC131047335 n=1 Tax=Cryptomeria japonica TaxID=3369 RepID=UPI0027D9D889|nr:uncharacterized protein LOC131047335 [Cryptomeria japonica]